MVATNAFTMMLVVIPITPSFLDVVENFLKILNFFFYNHDTTKIFREILVMKLCAHLGEVVVGTPGNT